MYVCVCVTCCVFILLLLEVLFEVHVKPCGIPSKLLLRSETLTSAH